jgi:multiple sugar transport system permease protein
MFILKRFEPYLFLLPSIIILFAFLFIPLIWNIYISLHDVSILTIIKDWDFIGFENFDNIFSDPHFYNSLKVTLVFVIGTVLLQFGIGLLIALLLNQQIRASGLFRTLFIIPWTVSTVITGFSFISDSDYYGIEKSDGCFDLAICRYCANIVPFYNIISGRDYLPTMKHYDGA